MIMVVYFVLGTCTFIINNLPPSFIPPLLFISAFPPPPISIPSLKFPPLYAVMLINMLHCLVLVIYDLLY